MAKAGSGFDCYLISNILKAQCEAVHEQGKEAYTLLASIAVGYVGRQAHGVCTS